MVTQLAMAVPANGAQGMEPPAADRPQTASSSRQARRSARFSDVLGGVVEENGLTDGKRKPGKTLAEELGVAYPFLPPVPGKVPIRTAGGSVTRTPESNPDGGAEGAVALAPNGSSSVRLASAGAPPAACNAESGAVLAPFDSGAFIPPKNTTKSGESLLYPGRMVAPEAGRPTAMSGLLTNWIPRPADALDASKATCFQPAADSQGPDLQALVPAIENSGLVAANSEISVQPEGWPSRGQPGLPAQPQGVATDEPQRPVAANSEISVQPEGWPSQGRPGLPAQPQGMAADEPKRPVAANSEISVQPGWPSRGRPDWPAQPQGTSADESQHPSLPAHDADYRSERTNRTASGLRLEPTATDDPASLVAPAAADASVVRMPAAGSIERPGAGATAGLAFTARLVPLPAAAAAAPAPVPVPAADEKPQDAVPANTSKPDTTRTPALSAARISKDLKDDASDGYRANDPAPETSAPRVLSPLPPSGSLKPPAESAGDTATKEQAGPPLRQTGATETAKDSAPAAPAREIQLQLQRGEQRVEVRLSERSGEVRVAVRTPDAQLAGALRADLPGLSARLEQTGFRAETWHPPIFHESARHAVAVAPSSSDSPDGQAGSRQGGQQQQEPRQPKPNTAHTAAKSQRKEFRWLMSQLP